jgi:hypothetical protein
MNKKIHFTLFAALLLLSFTTFDKSSLKKQKYCLKTASIQKLRSVLKRILNPSQRIILLWQIWQNLWRLRVIWGQADLWYKGIPSGAEVDPNTFKKHGDLLKKMGHYNEALASYKNL